MCRPGAAGKGAPAKRRTICQFDPCIRYVQFNKVRPRGGAGKGCAAKGPSARRRTICQFDPCIRYVQFNKVRPQGAARQGVSARVRRLGGAG